MDFRETAAARLIKHVLLSAQAVISTLHPCKPLQPSCAAVRAAASSIISRVLVLQADLLLLLYNFLRNGHYQVVIKDVRYVPLSHPAIGALC